MKKSSFGFSVHRRAQYVSFLNDLGQPDRFVSPRTDCRVDLFAGGSPVAVTINRVLPGSLLSLREVAAWWVNLTQSPVPLAMGPVTVNGQ